MPQYDVARGGNDTKTKTAGQESAARRSPMRDLEGEQRDATREKTLAALILMLRNGRGAR